MTLYLHYKGFINNNYKREMNKCAKYVENNKCNLTDYLKYTGAVYK